MNAAKQCVAAAAAAAGVVVLAVLAMGSCGCDHEMVGAGAAPPPPPDAAPPLARTYDYTQKVSVSAKHHAGQRWTVAILRFGDDKAVEGRSLRACVNAFCLECVCWQSNEVRMCTDQACPLYAVRPYRCSGNPSDGGFIGAESTNVS